MRTPPSAGCGRRRSELSVKMQKPIGSGRGKSAVPNRFFGVVFAVSRPRVAPSSITAGGRDGFFPDGKAGAGRWSMPGWRAAGGVGPYGWCGGVLSTNRGLGVSAAGWGGQGRPPLRRVSRPIAMQPFARVADAGVAGHIGPALRTVVDTGCHATGGWGCRRRVWADRVVRPYEGVLIPVAMHPGFGGIGGGLGRTGSSAPTKGC